MTCKPTFWNLAALAAAGVVAFAAVSAQRPAAHAAGGGGYVPRARGTLTFTKDIAPILLKQCADCHRSGQIGPFSLLSYQDVKKRATQIAAVTQSRYMPPWHADSHGEFVDERRLTADQIGEIKQWADEGAAAGAAKDMPALPKYPEGWMLGKPDLVLEMSKSYTMRAEGGDVYRCFVLPTGVTEDKYVAAMEVHPGNSRIVHHVIAYLDRSGKARQLEAQNHDGLPGYSVAGGIGIRPTGALGGWAPGNLPRLLPDGVGTLLQKNSDVVLQVHYHSSGKQETDQTKLGIYFCKKPVDKRLRVTLALAALNIPAGDAHYETKGGSLRFDNDVSVLEVMPHMHLLGRDMAVTANLPNGSHKAMIKVPDWDFNWQTTYMYKNPVKLPAGTDFNLVAHYDNSTGNPRNPNSPPRKVTWGEQTTDEMCIAFIWYTIDRESITQGKPVEDLLDKLSGVGNGNGGGRRLRRLVGGNQ